MAPPGTPAPAPAGRTFLQRLRRWVILLVLGGIVLFALYTWAAWSYAYSEGDRAGYVQKFSKRGWLCKTWEGELAMANLPGAMPEVFEFTVVDGAVAEEINKQMGQRVALHYKQHLGLPTTCFGDTTYFVNEIRRVTE
jgi:hypothetical protein